MNPLTLGSAAELLGEQSRIFTDVYKMYGFNDTQNLSEYTDFFLHEPVAWFEGLPSSLKSKASYAKPKTAFSKLMKQAEVIAVLGEEVCTHIHEVLWNTYKTEADRIVASRSEEPVLEVHRDEEQKPRRSRRQKAVVPEENVVETVAKNPGAMTYETKYHVIDRAFRAMLGDISATNEAMLVFLNALKEA